MPIARQQTAVMAFAMNETKLEKRKPAASYTCRLSELSTVLEKH